MAGTRVALAALVWMLAALATTPLSVNAVSKLPPYVTACSRSDPKINECIVRVGRNAIPAIMNGDPKYRVPKLNPLVIPELHLRQGSESVGLKLSWKNAELYGLKDADFREASIDLQNGHLQLKFFMPYITITGTYTSSGRVLLLPITGTGPSNITVEKMKVTYDIDWKPVPRKNGKEYIEVFNPKMTLNHIGFMSLKFQNLFNGDRLLGSNMNQFLNDNWKELAKEFGPGVADAIGEVFKLILKNICDIVPYDLVIKP